MKKTVFMFLAVLAILASAFDVQSMPANPDPIVFVQPDGTTLTIKIKGDERISWRQTVDEYTLMRNNDGYLTYAIKDSNGDLQPSNIIATDVDQRGMKSKSMLSTLEKNLFYSDNQVKTMLEIWDISDSFKSSDAAKVSSVGTKKILVALTGFSADEYIPEEEPFERTNKEFFNMLNQMGYTDNGAKGSVRDYFLESSYGKLDLTFSVAGPYLAPKSEWYYTGGKKNSRCSELAKWLVQSAVDDGFDMADYDSDGDGIVDCFHFVYAGNGQESTAIEGTIWSHKGPFSNFGPITIGGKKFASYSCSAERNANSKTAMTTIGVMCHEITHVFGAPDYYDTNYETGGLYDGTGNWDVMANGAYNGSPKGSVPAFHNPYQKMRFEWVTPIDLTEPTSVYTMPNSAEHPTVYKIQTKTDNEYFLLENRQKIGFDKHVPGEGLVVYRVSSNITNSYSGYNDVNATHPQKMYVVSSNAPVPIPTSDPASYGRINTTGCAFPGSLNKTDLTDETTPSLQSWKMENTEKPITNITLNKELRTVSFDFIGGFDSQCESPINLTGEFVEDYGVRLKWEAPEGISADSYNVYRYDVLVKENSSVLEYTDTEYQKLNYAYYVTANIGECESKPSNITKVEVQKDMFLIDASANIPEAATITGSGEYEKDSKVILKVFVNEGYIFRYWAEDDIKIEVSSTLQFQATRNRNIVAVLEPKNGIKDVEKNGINIFAHNNMINVVANQDNNETVKIDIIDVNGRIVKTAILEGCSLSIPVEGNGVFIIRAISDSKVYSKKVIL